MMDKKVDRSGAPGHRAPVPVTAPAPSMAADGEGGADRDPGSLRHVASVPLLGELQLTGEGPPLPPAAAGGAAGDAAGDAAGTDPESGKASSGPPSRRGYVPPERRSGWLQTAVVL